ncbi:hypothetical protein [Amnibacterium kyonggiense]|uniref:Uncharacterized protein n=1 Tax=Amnibacterium kyonggiense TaxID=595671 RepID=A0A4R7FEX7_9MICO|nr:hypothetical protein [Amnibacterium kyonggiense]TDS75923.1 hypothetical protein CLV52_3034 [Amnibacterium kyonggiense]
MSKQRSKATMRAPHPRLDTDAMARSLVERGLASPLILESTGFPFQRYVLQKRQRGVPLKRTEQ